MKENLTIILTAAQRNLLLQYEALFNDVKLFRLISVALKKENQYHIALTPDQLSDLICQIIDICPFEPGDSKLDKLEDLSEYLEQLLDKFEGIEIDEFEEEDEEEEEEVSTNTGQVYVMKVQLAAALKIWRRIHIREGQTLEDLHNTIFEAYDREEEHLYSFFFPAGPAKFNPRQLYHNSLIYSHPCCLEDSSNDSEDDATQTTIGSLDLLEGQVFYYLFDFGDEWWHQITVEKILAEADKKKYPRIVEKKNPSPPQYPDPEDFDDPDSDPDEKP